ncbi:hypothetical protein [Legionella longbeachae]|uniref:hypothetical protein n=1 Tax=Legionella longbeachae TaxID=450 RepID=UPI001CD96F1B|nr:hypothetical protein [Legionella longbeachae]
MKILLLVAAIATFAAWLADIKSIGKTSDFQAHSAKYTSALSIVFLGKHVLKKTLLLTQERFQNVLMMLYQPTYSSSIWRHSNVIIFCEDLSGTCLGTLTPSPLSRTWISWNALSETQLKIEEMVSSIFIPMKMRY